ncbi:TetR/AcrR family transcriptional regulator [Ruegeria pomeroyi]|nr:TetR/AcrR family transcriptional regulator [Ruegeria pomeroyi]
MKDDVIDPKQQAILDSAWQVFAAYGFRKTSMDDIARGARMSRPAVYLYFKNKEAIFRAVVQYCYDLTAKAVAAALGAGGAVPEVLERAFAAHGQTVMALLDSPHGVELLDAGSSTAPDIVEAGEAGLCALYADWLSREATAGRVMLSGPAPEVAATIAAALKGVKMTTPDFATYQTRIVQLAQILGAGLMRG